MIIYIDSDCKCHTEAGGRTEGIETEYFDGKCAAYIEGFRFVPAGRTWKREDGAMFSGEMIAPWKDYSWLAAIQEQYEQSKAQLAEYEAALAEIETALGVAE